MEINHRYVIEKDDFTDMEIWLLTTMVSQMDELVNRLDRYPTYVDICNDWYGLKEKMGLEDLDEWI